MPYNRPTGLRVLLLNQYFPPDNAATATGAERAVARLANRGHHLTVIAGRPSYRPSRTYRWRPVRRDIVNRARVLRVGSTAFSRARSVGRVTNYLTYAFLAMIIGGAHRADAVLVMTDPPVAVFIAHVIARMHRASVVYWIQDFHPDMAVAARLIPDNSAVSLWRAMHHRVLRRSDAIVVLGEDTADRVIDAGAPHERVHVIPSGAPVGVEPARSNREHRVAAELRGPADFVVMHAGNLGYAGAWGSLVAAIELVGDPHVILTFIGDGVQRKRLAAFANTKLVRFEDFRPLAQRRYVLASGDLQVVTVHPELTGLLVPSKIYGVLAAGRPVLAVWMKAPTWRDSYCVISAASLPTPEAPRLLRRLLAGHATIQLPS